MIEKLLGTSQIAEALGVSRSWILKHAAGRGVLLPSLKVGKFRRFREADVERFLALCQAIASDAAAARQRRGRRMVA